jgi:hypothetical protein
MGELPEAEPTLMRKEDLSGRIVRRMADPARRDSRDHIVPIRFHSGSAECTVPNAGDAASGIPGFRFPGLRGVTLCFWFLIWASRGHFGLRGVKLCFWFLIGLIAARP